MGTQKEGRNRHIESAPNRFTLFFCESEIQSLAPQVSKNLKVHPAYSRNMHEVLLLASCTNDAMAVGPIVRDFSGEIVLPSIWSPPH